MSFVLLFSVISCNWCKYLLQSLFKANAYFSFSRFIFDHCITLCLFISLSLCCSVLLSLCCHVVLLFHCSAFLSFVFSSCCLSIVFLFCRSVDPLFCRSVVLLFCCSVVLSFCLSIVLSFSLNLSVHLNSSKVVPVSFLTGVLTKFFLSYKLRTTPGPWTIVPINAQSSNPLTIEAQACCGILNKTGRWTTTKLWWAEQSVILREINDHVSPPPVIYHK